MASRRRKGPHRVTITVNASGRPAAIAKVLRDLADDLEAAGDEAHGIERVLENGGGRPIGHITIEDED